MLALSLRPVPFSLAVLGGVLLVVSMVWARHDRIHPLEMRVFRTINRLPGWLYAPLWVPMQLGNLVVGTLAGLIVAWALGEVAIAVAVVFATLSKLLVERVIRRRMVAFAGARQRPGTSEPGAILRGSDVPGSGASFPSGHVILASAIATVLSTALPAGWVWVPWLLTLLVMVGRVYVGAHNPLDVTAGLGAGLLIGGALDLLLR
jgi:glycosyltransferase 2 family protein